jgi:hypothetical protein
MRLFVKVLKATVLKAAANGGSGGRRGQNFPQTARRAC